MILLLMGLILWKSNIFLRISGYELIGEFNSINGLLNNAEVRYRGYRVGRVFRVSPDSQSIKVYFRVEEGVNITSGSTLRVIFDGLVGEKYLDISPNPVSKTFYKPGATLSGYATSGIADFVDVGTQNLQELKEILGSFRDALASQEISDAMKTTILSLRSITNNIDKVVGDLSEISSEVDIKKVAQNLEEITTKINRSMDDDFVEKTREIQDNLLTFSRDLKKLVGEEGFKKEVASTLKEGRRVLKSSGDILGALSSISLESKLNYYYKTPSKTSDYAADFDFWIGDAFLRLGVENRSGADNLSNIQQSIRIYKGLRARFGLFYSKPGVGLDYEMGRSIISSEMYNFDILQVDLLLRYGVFDYMDVIGGVSDVGNEDREYMLGFSFFSNKKSKR